MTCLHPSNRHLNFVISLNQCDILSWYALRTAVLLVTTCGGVNPSSTSIEAVVQVRIFIMIGTLFVCNYHHPTYTYGSIASGEHILNSTVAVKYLNALYLTKILDPRAMIEGIFSCICTLTIFIMNTQVLLWLFENDKQVTMTPSLYNLVQKSEFWRLLMLWRRAFSKKATTSSLHFLLVYKLFKNINY